MEENRYIFSTKYSHVSFKKSDVDEILLKKACIDRIMREIPHAEMAGSDCVLQRHFFHCIKFAEKLRKKEPISMVENNLEPHI